MKLFKIFPTLVLISISLVGCNEKTENSEIKEEKLIKTTEVKSSLPDDAPTYTVYTINSFEPYCFRDEYGNSTGFDIDLLNAIGEAVGFKTAYIITPWDKVLQSLSDEKSDIVASAVVINDERKQKYSFSNPYIVSNLALMVAEKNIDKSFDSIIADKNMKYSLLSATSAEKVLVNDLGVKEESITNTATQFLSVKQVLNGVSDATFEDETTLHYYSKEYQGLYIKPYDKKSTELGFVVKKDNTKLLEQINNGLTKVKADGTFDKIYTKWFGEKPK